MVESQVERRTEWARPAGDDHVYVDGKRVEFAEPPKSWVEVFACARHARFVSLEEGKRRLASRRDGRRGWTVERGRPQRRGHRESPDAAQPRLARTTSDEPIPTSGAAVLKGHPGDAGDARGDV